MYCVLVLRIAYCVLCIAQYRIYGVILRQELFFEG